MGLRIGSGLEGTTSMHLSLSPFPLSFSLVSQYTSFFFFFHFLDVLQAFPRIPYFPFPEIFQISKSLHVLEFKVDRERVKTVDM